MVRDSNSRRPQKSEITFFDFIPKNMRRLNWFRATETSLSLIIFLIFLSCKEAKTEFILVENRTYKYVADSGERRLEEVVFIINPPNRVDELFKVIAQYNENTISKDSIEKGYDRYDRLFFRESKTTPRDFVDDEGFSPDRLFDHLDDYIGTYRMKVCDPEKKFPSYEWLFTGEGGYADFETKYFGTPCNRF